MDLGPIILDFEKLIPLLQGVKLYFADYDPESRRSDIGLGMYVSLIRFLRDPGPALVVGVESESALAQRGFSQFLDLPAVKYLQLPFHPEKLLGTANSVRSIGVTQVHLDNVVGEVARLTLENVGRNVIHQLDAMEEDIQESVFALRQASFTDDDSQFRLNSEVIARQLRYYSTRLADTVAILGNEINRIDDIIPVKMSATLMNMQDQLVLAKKYFERLTLGIEAWARHSLDYADMEPRAVDGENVLSILEYVRTTFEALEEKCRAVA